MLARSPIPASTPNASPRSTFSTFHYASAPSPRLSSSAQFQAAALSRRQSASSPVTSMPSPPLPRKKNVYADKATQYSPMEPVNYFAAGSRTSLRPPSTDTDIEPPPSPEGPKPMALPEERPASTAPPRSSKVTKTVPPKADTESSVVQPISPSKRRNSQGPGGSSAALFPGEASFPKRSRQDSAAPKVLPLRYELVSVEDMVILIAHMLGELIETNDAIALKAGHLTRFHSR